MAELMAAPKRLAPGPYREGGSDVEQPFVVELDALPLLTFIEAFAPDQVMQSCESTSTDFGKSIRSSVIQWVIA